MSQNEITPARFGLPILDAALGGGVPRGSVILLEDEIGVEADFGRLVLRSDESKLFPTESSENIL